MNINAEILFAFVGTLIGGMGGYIMFIEKRHRKERKEWAERDEKNMERMDERAESTEKVIRENSNILSGLKALFENQIRNGR
jgi:hypothetical protein